MLNAEKYRDELKSLNDADRLWYTAFDKYNMTLCDCSDVECENCAFNSEEGCNNARYNWLLSEYRETVKLSRLEYEILKHVQKEGFNFITRNNCGNSVIHENKPIKHDGSIGWGTTSKSYMLYAFNGLFSFVKWEDEKPTSIKEVLENCEVVEDESNE